MANQALDDLLAAAEAMDPNYRGEIDGPWIDAGEDSISLGTRPRWRLMVPPIIRRLWERLDFETRVAVFVVAASEESVDWN